MRIDCKYTSVAAEELEKALQSQLTTKSKALFKKVNAEADKAKRRHFLRIGHSELLEGICNDKHHPLWERSSITVRHYTRWILGRSSAWDDKKRDAAGDRDYCRLCGNEGPETRQHLLTYCPETQNEIIRFYEHIQNASSDKHRELNALPDSRKWIWILAGGTIRDQMPDPIGNHRITSYKPPIIPGESVKPVKNKRDTNQCMDAYCEYREIVSNLERQHIRIYTDGSTSTQDQTSGFGVRIIFSHTGIETKLLDYERGLGNASISQAELTAVHTAMRWYVFENQYHYPVLIFTDSKYTYDAVSSPNPRKNIFTSLRKYKILRTKSQDTTQRSTSNPICTLPYRANSSRLVASR